MELPDGKQLKVVIHCNDCGYTKANIYPNLKLLTKSGFLVHDVPGSDEKCMDLGVDVWKISTKCGENDDFVFYSLFVWNP